MFLEREVLHCNPTLPQDDHINFSGLLSVHADSIVAADVHEGVRCRIVGLTQDATRNESMLHFAIASFTS